MVEVNARETWAKAMRHIENIVFAPTNDVGQKKVIWDHGKTMLLQNLVEVTKRFNPDIKIFLTLLHVIKFVELRITETAFFVPRVAATIAIVVVVHFAFARYQLERQGHDKITNFIRKCEANVSMDDKNL